MSEQTLIIIGNGMMSWKLCHKLVELGAHSTLEIVVFGEEPRPAYDRVHLTDLFSGKTADDLTLAPEDWYADHGIALYLGDPIVEIDTDNCVVRSASGLQVPYDRLVFATGSRPFVPPIPGVDAPGVFVYRTVEHLEAIMEYGRTIKRAAVIGGGLLGLEAAKAARDLGLEVEVVEFAPGLLPRQLDAAGAGILKHKIEALGVRVHLGKQTLRIEDEPPINEVSWQRQRTLHFADGTKLAVDMVVISAGIRPRSELAEAAGLALAKNGGIIVDDHLTTSDPRIFAVGECAIHRGTTYGLAFPGYQMVEILIDNLLGGTAKFEGADVSAKLKLLGITVASLGEHNEKELPSATANTFLAHGMYRKIVMRDGRIIGAVTVGEWENLDRVRDAIEQPRVVSFWDMRRFRSTGNLWLKSESPPIAEWPEDALVCGCLRVTRGALTFMVLDGCGTVEELCGRTGAGTMCGSCKPLLAELLGGPASSVRDRDLPPMSVRIQDPPPTSRRSRDGAPLSVRNPALGPASVRHQRRALGLVRNEAPVERDTPAPPSVALFRSTPPSVSPTLAPPTTTPKTLPPVRSTEPTQPSATLASPTRAGSVVSPTPPVSPTLAPPPPPRVPESEMLTSADAGPLSRRGSLLPPITGRRAPTRSSRHPMEIEPAPPSTGRSSEHASADPPPSTRFSFTPPKLISFVPMDEQHPAEIEPAPPSTGRSSELSPAGPPSSTRLSFMPPKRISFIPRDEEHAEASGPVSPRSVPRSVSSRYHFGMDLRSDEIAPIRRRSILPPLPEPDDLLPPPDSARLQREMDDLLGEAYSGRGSFPEPRLSSSRDSQSGEVEHDSSEKIDALQSVPYDTAPASRRRDSLPPLRPLSVAPPKFPSAPDAFPPSPRISVALPKLPEERWQRQLLAVAIGAVPLVFGLLLLPAIPPAQTIQGWHIDVLWTSSVGKQVSGYVIVALGLVSLLLSLRKRWKRFAYSDVATFRMIHSGLGALTLIALALHTGLHLGRNLNRVLMIDFLALTLLGAVAAGVTALQHWWRPVVARDRRVAASMAHLVLFWPLPVLLVLHILGAYYY